jgi:hypothetical protein
MGRHVTCPWNWSTNHIRLSRNGIWIFPLPESKDQLGELEELREKPYYNAKMYKEKNQEVAR